VVLITAPAAAGVTDHQSIERAENAGSFHSVSVNGEIEDDVHQHIDRRDPETSRLEPPLGNGRYGFFIEASAV
jgi:hypothetical protein